MALVRVIAKARSDGYQPPNAILNPSTIDTVTANLNSLGGTTLCTASAFPRRDIGAGLLANGFTLASLVELRIFNGDEIFVGPVADLVGALSG
jgi:hypothetical protein